MFASRENVTTLASPLRTIVHPAMTVMNATAVARFDRIPYQAMIPSAESDHRVVSVGVNLLVSCARGLNAAAVLEHFDEPVPPLRWKLVARHSRGRTFAVILSSHVRVLVRLVLPFAVAACGARDSPRIDSAAADRNVTGRTLRVA